MTHRVRRLLLVYALAWAGFLGLLWLARQHPFFGWDPVVADAIEVTEAPILDRVMRAASAIGIVEVGVALITLTTVIALVLRLWQEAGLFLLSPLGEVLNFAAKVAAHRLRPQPEELNTPAPLANDSFPSGHTVFATYFLGLIVLILLARAPARPARHVAVGGLILLIVLVGVSRIYLGVHWPSDVLGGFWLGGLWLAALGTLYAWARRRGQGVPKPA